jgi:hypothetical protein
MTRQAQQSQMREDLPDHGGIVQRSDQPQATPNNVCAVPAAPAGLARAGLGA